MTDDPTTQDLAAEQSTDSFEDQLRRLSPSPLQPYQQAFLAGTFRARRRPYLQAPIAYQDVHSPQPDTARGYPSNIWMPTIVLRGDADHQWRRMQRRLRRAERLRTMRGIIRRTVLRYPWLTLPLIGWAAIYGLCRLIGWLVSITF